MGQDKALVAFAGLPMIAHVIERLEGQVAALRASGEFVDVAVVGVPDPAWGQVVVACYPAGGAQPDDAKVAAALAGLAGYKRPKRFVAVADWPRNAQGKLNRVAVIAAVAASS